MKRRRNKLNLSSKLNNILYFLSGILVVVLVGIGVIAVQTNAQSNGMDDYGGQITVMDTENVVSSDGAGDDNAVWVDDGTNDHSISVSNEAGQDGVEKWQEGVISYKGKNYIYNADLKIYLVMGIDNEGIVEEAKDGVSGGQSDAMFLLIEDDELEKVTMVSINRNTMTPVEVYDEDGTYVGTWDAQICTQHGFGDGKKLSCMRTVDAVSKLFDNIPIYGYISMNMGAIPYLNNAVGGVEVKVLSDVIYEDEGVNLKKGQKVKLNDTEAYYYLRGRDINEFDSATDRLKRDEQYFLNYMNLFKKKSQNNLLSSVSIYNSIDDYIVTNVNFTSVMDTLVNYDIDSSNVYSVPGKTETVNGFESFYVDDEEFMDLKMSLFYEECD